ncbi:Uncharacterised protein [Mycobacteroides abscessus subsp. abscessus]|nr:Uncharacterised protein [Mycobacteroides abscessus subsp. abscessus]
MEDEFAECAEDEEDEDAAHGVGDEQAGACVVEAGARTHEQAGSDRATDGDHLDLPRFECLLIALVLVGEC